MKLSKKEFSWILYDCGNSAYSIIVNTAIFPLYYSTMAVASGLSDASATAMWNYANSFSVVLIAILSPILGAIADYKGYKMKLFNLFALMGIMTTAALGLIPGHLSIVLLICYVITRIGFNGSIVFYDAFLIDVTEDKRMDNVSSIGFAWGYIASVLPFILCIYLIQFSGLDVTIMTKISFILTAIWWFVFTCPLMKNVKQVHYIPKEPQPIRKSFQRLKETLVHIKDYKVVAFFLVAYFFYIDGVDTVITNAAVFGNMIGLNSTGLMLALLLTQVVAFPSAIIYGKLAEKFSAKRMILVGIITYFIVCIFAYFMENLFHFIILAILIASAQGGIQALSRSYFAKIIPKSKAAEFFGFYNIFGKFASFFGPLLIAMTMQLTGNIRISVMSLIILFGLGLILFLKLPDDENLVQIKE